MENAFSPVILKTYFKEKPLKKALHRSPFLEYLNVESAFRFIPS